MGTSEAQAFRQNPADGELNELDLSNPPPLHVEVTYVNMHSHLEGVVSYLVKL